jgi:hypothetical protein
MGRAAVRAAVVATITNGNLPYLGSVYPARPVYATEEAYTASLTGQAIQESANGSACVMVVNILSDDRTRYADVGRAAVADFNKHLVQLELFFACETQGNLTVADAGIAAQQDYDTIVDALTILIRANPTMGAPASVWSAAEFSYGVRHEQSVAFNPQQSTSVLINGLVSFQAWEQDVGTGV